MDRDQLIKEIIFDKLMQITDNKESVRQLRVSIQLQNLNFWLTNIQIYKNLYCRKKNSKKGSLFLLYF